jgi:hypothetical protein
LYFLKEEYNVNKTIKGACLVAATAMLPLSQAATAGEVNISGWINEGMFYYDDSNNSDVVASQDNGTTLSSRIAFTGTQELPNSGLTAGFELTFEPTSGLGADNGATPLLSYSQASDGQNNFGGDIGLLASNIHFGGGFGKITLGTQTMPTDNIAVLSDPSLTLWSGVSPVFRGNGYVIQGLGAGAANTTWASNLACVTTPGLGIGFDCNGVYRTGIRYDLPAFAGVKIAVGYANDDIYDISLNHSGSIAGLNTVLGMGYAINQGAGAGLVGGDGETQVFQVQGGLMDPGTGIFGSVAYMNDEADGAGANTGDEIDSYFIKVGIKRAFNSLGDTAISFKYGSYNDAFGAGDVGMTGSEVERVGVELVQYFGAGFQIYGTWEQLDLDIDCGETAVGAAATCAANYGGAEELDMFALGATYFF